MKYPSLEEPCKSCIYKCGRVEEPTFIKDEKCRYKEIKATFKKIEGTQERIKI